MSLLFAALAAMSATPLVAAIISPSLPPGSEYQLIFATDGGMVASSKNINDYNAFVDAQADLNIDLPAATWRTVGSTSSIDAAVNAPWISGVPVYNTAGELVADSIAGLYAGSLNMAVSYDQFGDLAPSRIWTGSTALGMKFAGRELGSAGPIHGNSTSTNGRWLNLTGDNPGNKYGLYALSSPITVVPEPASMVLWGSALSVIAGLRLLRWRRVSS